MRQFISGLPDELIDAARVDGAGELRIFASIVMPLCGPAIATLGILTFWVPGTTSYGHSWWRKRRTSTRCRSHSPCTRSPRTPPRDLRADFAHVPFAATVFRARHRDDRDQVTTGIK
jgi:hypothetical protein